MGGVTGIFAGLFGVFWTIMAVSMGAAFMAPFGILFMIIAVISAVYNFKNATGKNRYSAFDIVDHNEEIDPLNERYGNIRYSRDYSDAGSSQTSSNLFCPYCGNKVSGDFEFCNKCGKKLP